MLLQFKYAFVALLTCIAGSALIPAQAQSREHAATVTCSSHEHRRNQCATPFRGRAVLIENLSGTRCIEGRNWGSGDGYLWVEAGCRGRFAPAHGGGGHADRLPPRRYDDRPGHDEDRAHHRPGGNTDYRVSCASNDRRQRSCNWDRRQGRPYLQRQLSATDCEEGRSWGWRGDRIWVDHGCRAVFGAR